VDIDPKAIGTCERNCTLNGVSRRAELVCGEIEQLAADPFELALANMFGDVLLVVAEALVTRTRPGGTLLLSGILFEHDFEVRRRFASLGCTVLCHRMMEEFTTVLLRRE
jgi:ribosomal protein L11 methyltransferase